MKIFIDYNGMQNGRPHNGGRGIPAGPQRTMLLTPGVQGIDRELWNAARTHPAIGWVDAEAGKAGKYMGEAWLTGELKEMPATKNRDAVDWSKVDQTLLQGDRGIIERTISPAVLSSLHKYALRLDSDLHKVVKTHLDDCLEGHDGEKSGVVEAEARIVRAA